jgi:hypothetical protein
MQRRAPGARRQGASRKLQAAIQGTAVIDPPAWIAALA